MVGIEVDCVVALGAEPLRFAGTVPSLPLLS